MTTEQVKQNLKTALAELLPKHQYKEFPGFKGRIARLEEPGFKLKKFYSDNAHDKESPRYWGLWNEKIQKAGEKIWADGKVSKIKAYDWPVDRLKKVIKLWTMDQADYALHVRNSYDFAVYERKAKSWEGFFHIVVLFYRDEEFGKLPSDKELVDKVKALEAENEKLNNEIDRHVFEGNKLKEKIMKYEQNIEKYQDKIEALTSRVKWNERELQTLKDNPVEKRLSEIEKFGKKIYEFMQKKL